MTLCAPVIAVPVHNNTGNRFSFAVESADGGLMASLAGITRVTVQVGETLIDSDVVGASVIWWTDTKPFRGDPAVPVVSFRLGGQGLAPGSYEQCEMTLYDEDQYTGGLRILNDLSLRVYA